MPATRRKSKTPPRNTAPAEDEITVLARGMTISEPTNEWSSPNWSFPYVIYAYKDEEQPLRHMHVNIMMLGVPENFIRKIEVLSCGKKLSVLVGTPRWFYETTYLTRVMGNNFHAQHAAVDNFEENVVQPVRHISSRRTILGSRAHRASSTFLRSVMWVMSNGVMDTSRLQMRLIQVEISSTPGSLS